jgi:hypothetical protein
MNVTSIPKKQMVPLFIRGKNTVDFVIPGLGPESSLTNNEAHSNNESDSNNESQFLQAIGCVLELI